MASSVTAVSTDNWNTEISPWSKTPDQLLGQASVQQGPQAVNKQISSLTQLSSLSSQSGQRLSLNLLQPFSLQPLNSASRGQIVQSASSECGGPSLEPASFESTGNVPKAVCFPSRYDLYLNSLGTLMESAISCSEEPRVRITRPTERGKVTEVGSQWARASNSTKVAEGKTRQRHDAPNPTAGSRQATTNFGQDSVASSELPREIRKDGELQNRSGAATCGFQDSRTAVQALIEYSENSSFCEVHIGCDSLDFGLFDPWCSKVTSKENKYSNDSISGTSWKLTKDSSLRISGKGKETEESSLRISGKGKETEERSLQTNWTKKTGSREKRIGKDGVRSGWERNSKAVDVFVRLSGGSPRYMFRHLAEPSNYMADYRTQCTVGNLCGQWKTAALSGVDHNKKACLTYSQRGVTNFLTSPSPEGHGVDSFIGDRWRVRSLPVLTPIREISNTNIACERSSGKIVSPFTSHRSTAGLRRSLSDSLLLFSPMAPGLRMQQDLKTLKQILHSPGTSMGKQQPSALSQPGATFRQNLQDPDPSKLKYTMRTTVFDLPARFQQDARAASSQEASVGNGQEKSHLKSRKKITENEYELNNVNRLDFHDQNKLRPVTLPRRHCSTLALAHRAAAIQVLGVRNKDTLQEQLRISGRGKQVMDGSRENRFDYSHRNSTRNNWMTPPVSLNCKNKGFLDISATIPEDFFPLKRRDSHVAKIAHERRDSHVAKIAHERRDSHVAKIAHERRDSHVAKITRERRDSDVANPNNHAYLKYSEVRGLRVDAEEALGYRMIDSDIQLTCLSLQSSQSHQADTKVKSSIHKEGCSATPLTVTD